MFTKTTLKIKLIYREKYQGVSWLAIRPPNLLTYIYPGLSSWGAGVPVWSLGDGDKATEPPQTSQYDDGIVEVFGIYSSFHIAQLQVST